MGIGKDGQPKASHEPGIELHAKYTFFAEGVRGNLGKQLMDRYNLRDGVSPDLRYRHQGTLGDDPGEAPGRLVMHTAGYPLTGKPMAAHSLSH